MYGVMLKRTADSVLEIYMYNYLVSLTYVLLFIDHVKFEHTVKDNCLFIWVNMISLQVHENKLMLDHYNQCAYEHARVQVSESGPLGPLVYVYCLQLTFIKCYKLLTVSVQNILEYTCKLQSRF